MEKQKQPSRNLRMRRLIPNMITLVALSIGLTAVRLALEGDFDLAVIFVFVAGLLDVFDGRVARLLGAESPIGEQLDSLSDFLNFGVASVFLLYLWGLDDTGRGAWLILLLYVSCSALRLARFNVAISRDDQPAWHGYFFSGVPSPAAGCLVMWPMAFYYADIIDLRDYDSLLLGNVLLAAILMLSPIPTISLKGMSQTIPRRAALPLMLGAAILAGALLTFPWISFTIMGGLYYLLVPISFLLYRRMQRLHA